MGKIRVEKIQTYAFHGCMDEEGKVGTDYSIDIEVDVDLITSALSDKLADTVDYVAINKIVYEEMAIRSELIETVALRILKRVKALNLVRSSTIWLSKINAPIGGQVQNVTVVMSTDEF